MARNRRFHSSIRWQPQSCPGYQTVSTWPGGWLPTWNDLMPDCQTQNLLQI